MSSILFVCSFYFGNTTGCQISRSLGEAETYLGKLLRRKGVSNLLTLFVFLLGLCKKNTISMTLKIHTYPFIDIFLVQTKLHSSYLQ